MESNSFDSLSSNGIVNYNVDTYLKTGVMQPPGVSAMYSPSRSYAPFGTLTPSMTSQPSSDAFVKRAGIDKENRTPWGKIITGTVLGGLAVFGGFKIKSAIKRRKANKEAATDTTQETKQDGKKGFFTRCKEKVQSWFTPKDEKAAKEAEKVAKEAEKTAKKGGKFTKGLKITGIAAAGVLAVLGAFSLIKSHLPHKEAIPQAVEPAQEA